MGTFINGVLVRDYAAPDADSTASVRATVTGIDLTATGSTTLYTVPTGKSFVLLEVVPRVTAASAANGDAVAQVEETAAAADLVPSTTLTGMTAVGDDFRLSPGIGGQAKILTAGETVKLNVTSAETGTTLTVSADVVGYLF